MIQREGQVKASCSYQGFEPRNASLPGFWGCLSWASLWGLSCRWLLLMAVKQSLRPLSLARVSCWPCVSFSFFLLEMGVQRTVPWEGLLPGEGVGTEWA